MKTRIQAYLVDDELPALKRLTRLLEDTGRVEVVGSNMNPVKAIEEISANMPEVLFLDIQMPVINGFELLSRLPQQPVVVFATAYDQYALKAFEVNSIDYLLKPIEPDNWSGPSINWTSSAPVRDRNGSTDQISERSSKNSPEL